MAQYEQKTDSREFEIANPEHGGGVAPADATEIAIRLWAASGSDRRVPPTWETDSILVYMIADLVVASRGHIVEESPTVMTARFGGSSQAIVAAKRIQMAILEFVACRPGGPVGAAILVYHPQASDPTGFTNEMTWRALGQAQPGQILLSESISQRLRDLPGIEFHVVPELASLGEDSDSALTELVWTTPERIAFLQNAVAPVGEPPDEEAPPFGATMIVHSPFAGSISANNGIPPVMPTVDFVFRDSAEADSPNREVARAEEDHARRLEDFQGSLGGSLTAELDALKEQKQATRTKAIVGIVAFVLAGVLVAMFYLPTHTSNVPVPPRQEPTGAKEIPIKVPPTAPTPKAKAVPAETVPNKPTAKVPEVIVPRQVPAKAKVDNPVNSGNETATAPAPVYEYGGFSQKDIPKLLEFARTDAGKGNYASSREEYSTVLKLQPSNQAAKDGLHKLDLIQQDQ